jgi:hypothetical protein
MPTPSMFFSMYSASEPWAFPREPSAPSVVWQSAQPMTELSSQANWVWFQ